MGNVSLLVAVIVLLTGGTTAFAGSDLTYEQRQKIQNQYVRDYMKVLRPKETQPKPPMVDEFHKKYTEMCRKRAEEEYKKHGRWFYCEDRKEFSPNIRWDEVVTCRIYGQLLSSYGSLEKIPNYSEENHRKAKEFWKKWQKEDGSFYNFLTGKGGDKQCNGKYLPGVLSQLKSRPLYKHTSHGGGAAELDIDKCFRDIASGNLNHGTATAANMLQRICGGKTEYIPALERAVELALTQLSPHTGMFHGRDGNPKRGDWTKYGTTEQTMKGVLRLVGYMGTENVPYRHRRADTLIINRTWFREGTAVLRNTAEMMIHCPLESPYRSEDLLKAFEGHADAIAKGERWRSHISGDYTAYALMLFGPYLNWEGYENSLPRNAFRVGAQYDWRVEVGPFGRCVNVIKKRPEEVLYHKDWSYAKYGLRARNVAHENRKVIDVVPASAEGWSRSTDEEGRVVLTRTLKLADADFDNPYIKIKWSGGDIEILLNGVLVKKKLVGMNDFGAVHIPEEARKTLKPGENTLVVRTGAKADALDVSAGLIDWK